jgi:anaerobic selenocysteine-containing dehydrogenase
MVTVRSVCPYDCPDACGMLVDVRDGRAVAVRGDPEHPYSAGTLCPKMNHYERTVHSPDRLTHPLVRTGPKGRGSFRRATWEEAIGIVADRLRAVVASHGAEAILPYSYAGTMGLVQRNAGHPFFHALGASRLDRTICSPAKDAGWAPVMGKTPGMHPDAVRESDLVVLWSINAVATSVHFAARVAEAKRRGAKVWLVDTYSNDTAALADRVVLVRPGSDGALALGMIHVIASEGLEDARFLAAETVGWPALKASALADYGPARVSALTGLPATTIEALAREYARARAPFIRLGGGLSRYGNGAMTVRTIACLPAVAGAWDRGGGLMHQASGSAAWDLSPLTREELQPRPTRLVNMNLLGRALNDLDAPRVMAMYVYASNPAAVAPDQGAVLRGLARDDLFLAVHERFLTDTARYADVVLPATSSLEHADLYRSYGHYAIQRARPAVPPVGESKSNWEVFRLLAAVMGLSDPLFGKDEDAVIDLLLARPSPWREGLDRARLDAGLPVELARPPGPRWATPSGRIELRSPTHAEPLPRWRPTHAEGAGPGSLWLVTGCNRFTLNSTFMERPELRTQAGGMVLRLAPGEAAARGLADGDAVEGWNDVGQARFVLRVSGDVPPGVAVAEGVWWLRDAPGGRNVNALCAQRLTDEAGGSTFYDNRIDVRRAP